MEDDFGSLQEQAQRIVNIIRDGDHPLHYQLAEIITIQQFRSLIKMAYSQYYDMPKQSQA